MPPSRCRAITSLNRKGGVGKTHLCWLIASLCQESGKRCLVVDLDPQANFTSSLLSDTESELSVAQLFLTSVEPDCAALVRQTAYEFIDVLPSSPRPEPFNITDRAAWESEDLHLSLSESVAELRPDYDYILFDCPPSLSLVSYAALCASDYVMVPLEAARWGALGTQHIAAAVEEVQARFNDRLRLLGYVVSRYKQRRAYQQTYLQQLREHFGEDAFDTVIPDLASFEKSVTDRIPITLHSPSSHASHIAHQFFAEVEDRCERFESLSEPVGRRSVQHAA